MKNWKNWKPIAVGMAYFCFVIIMLGNLGLIGCSSQPDNFKDYAIENVVKVNFYYDHHFEQSSAMLFIKQPKSDKITLKPLDNCASFVIELDAKPDESMWLGIEEYVKNGVKRYNYKLHIHSLDELK